MWNCGRRGKTGTARMSARAGDDMKGEAMRIAVLSDIHANRAALEAVLEQAAVAFPDRYVFLGDYVTDCPYPHRTVQLLRKFAETHRCIFIRGNREDYLLKNREQPQGWINGSKTGALKYTYENLTDEDLDWFAAMPITKRLELPGCEPLMICHGSPERSNYLFHTDTPEAEMMIGRLGEFGCRVMLCGHSHIPYVFRRGDRMLVNPGALGMPVNGQNKAQFALLQYNGEWSAEILSAEYDIERTAAEFAESGLLEMSGVWGRGILGTIREGINYTVMSVRLVEKMVRETGREVTDEALWEEAARVLGVPG
ncbi:MAG: metallophosphoesterase family protein [Oscillospiraceae bacterium]